MQSVSSRYHLHFGKCSDTLCLYLSLTNFAQASASISDVECRGHIGRRFTVRRLRSEG